MRVTEKHYGQVMAAFSNRYDVLLSEHDVTDNEVFRCQVKGLLKKAGMDVRVGDRVEVDELDTANQMGRIIDVLPRRGELSRPKIANVDQVMIVHPAAQPAFDSQQLDRYLVHAGLHQLPVIICMTKADLMARDTSFDAWVDLYQTQLGYKLWLTSIYQPKGYEGLMSACEGKITVLAGLSGAGKSTLLNQLNPSLQLQTGEVSEKLERGQHTTRHTSLLQPVDNVWIADTPGFSHLQFDSVTPSEIEATYPEFRQSGCGFYNCLHRGEEHCAIAPISDDGEPVPLLVSKSRYAHYRLFIEESESYATERGQLSQKEKMGRKKQSEKGVRTGKGVRLGQGHRGASRRQDRQDLTGYTQRDMGFYENEHGETDDD